jgi:hypothetical protein
MATRRTGSGGRKLRTGGRKAGFLGPTRTRAAGNTGTTTPTGTVGRPRPHRPHRPGRSTVARSRRKIGSGGRTRHRKVPLVVVPESLSLVRRSQAAARSSHLVPVGLAPPCLVRPARLACLVRPGRLACLVRPARLVRLVRLVRRSARSSMRTSSQPARFRLSCPAPSLCRGPSMSPLRVGSLRRRGRRSLRR